MKYYLPPNYLNKKNINVGIPKGYLEEQDELSSYTGSEENILAYSGAG